MNWKSVLPEAETKSSKVISDPAVLHTNIVLLHINEGTAADFIDRLETVRVSYNQTLLVYDRKFYSQYDP